MTLCISCGGETTDGILLCPYHAVGDVHWARVNRAFCDFLHRRIDPEDTLEQWLDDPWVAEPEELATV